MEVEHDLLQISQISVRNSSTQSESAPSANLKTEHKRIVDLVADSSGEDDSAPHKTIRLSKSPKPSLVQPEFTAPLVHVPPNWNTFIMHFNATDAKSDNVRAKDVRVSLQKFLYDAQHPVKVINPYELKFEGLDEYIRSTAMGRVLELANTYGWIAGDLGNPVPSDEGELSVMLTAWEFAQTVYAKSGVMVVELWKSIGSSANGDAQRSSDL